MSDSELEKTVTETQNANQTEKSTEPNLPDPKTELLAEIQKLEEKIKSGSSNSNLKKIQEKALDKAYTAYYALFANSSATSGSGSTSGFTKPNSTAQKSLNESLRRLRKFKGENFEQTPEFVDTLKQIYDCQISSKDVDEIPELRSYFMNQILSNTISNAVYKQIKTDNCYDKVSNDFEAFCEYILEHYTPKQNTLQIVAKIYDINWDEKSQKLHVPANEINSCLKNGWEVLNRTWKTEKQVENDMPGEEVFHFFGAIHLSEVIKQREYDTYTRMIKDFDKVFNASDVANKAEYYRGRLKPTGSTNILWNQDRSSKRNRGNRDGNRGGNRGGNRDDNRDKGRENKSDKDRDANKTQADANKGHKSKKSTKRDTSKENKSKDGAQANLVKPVDWTSRAYAAQAQDFQ